MMPIITTFSDDADNDMPMICQRSYLTEVQNSNYLQRDCVQASWSTSTLANDTRMVSFLTEVGTDCTYVGIRHENDASNFYVVKICERFIPVIFHFIGSCLYSMSGCISIERYRPQTTRRHSSLSLAFSYSSVQLTSHHSLSCKASLVILCVWSRERYQNI